MKEQLRKRLSTISIGMTTIVLGCVVTRWNDNAFEIDSWSRSIMTLDQAIESIMDKERKKK